MFVCEKKMFHTLRTISIVIHSLPRKEFQRNSTTQKSERLKHSEAGGKKRGTIYSRYPDEIRACKRIRKTKFKIS